MLAILILVLYLLNISEIQKIVAVYMEVPETPHYIHNFQYLYTIKQMTLKMKIIVLFTKRSWCNIPHNPTIDLCDLTCSSFTRNISKTEQCVRVHESEEDEEHGTQPKLPLKVSL